MHWTTATAPPLNFTLFENSSSRKKFLEKTPTERDYCQPEFLEKLAGLSRTKLHLSAC